MDYIFLVNAQLWSLDNREGIHYCVELKKIIKSYFLYRHIYQWTEPSEVIQYHKIVAVKYDVRQTNRKYFSPVPTEKKKNVFLTILRIVFIYTDRIRTKERVFFSPEWNIGGIKFCRQINGIYTNLKRF